MKAFLVTVLFLFSARVFADTTPKMETIRVANVLLGNPKAMAELNQANVSVVDYTISEVEQGQYTYTFELDRRCFCMPKPGTLIINQDLRPTYADGPIKYSYELTWKE